MLKFSRQKMHSITTKICVAFFIVLLYALFPLKPISSAWAAVSCTALPDFEYSGRNIGFNGGPSLGEGYWTLPGAWPPLEFGATGGVTAIYQTAGTYTATYRNRLGETTTCGPISIQTGGNCKTSNGTDSIEAPKGSTLTFTSTLSLPWSSGGGTPYSSTTDSTNFTSTFDSSGTYQVTVGGGGYSAVTGVCLAHIGTSGAGCTINRVCNYPTETCVNCSVDCGDCDPSGYKIYQYSNGASPTPKGNYNASVTATTAHEMWPWRWDMSGSSHFATAQVISGPTPRVAYCIGYGLFTGSDCWSNWYSEPDLTAPNGGCTATECRHNFTLSNPTNTIMTVKMVWDYSAPTTCTSPPLPPGSWSIAPLTTSTPISLRNITDLRIRIDALRIDAGLTAFGWTDSPLLVDTPTRAIHINELRKALLEVYTACTTVPPVFLLPANDVIPGVSLVSLTDITELRTAATNAP